MKKAISEAGKKVTQSYAENIRGTQRQNSVVLCGSSDLLCVTEKGLRKLLTTKDTKEKLKGHKGGA